jgi:hypothetical protein
MIHITDSAAFAEMHDHLCGHVMHDKCHRCGATEHAAGGDIATDGAYYWAMPSCTRARILALQHQERETNARATAAWHRRDRRAYEAHMDSLDELVMLRSYGMKV